MRFRRPEAPRASVSWFQPPERVLEWWSIGVMGRRCLGRGRRREGKLPQKGTKRTAERSRKSETQNPKCETNASRRKYQNWVNEGGRRILALPPTDDSISLSSFGGEGRGEEAAMPRSRSRPCLPRRLCPRWQRQDALTLWSCSDSASVVCSGTRSGEAGRSS